MRNISRQLNLTPKQREHIEAILHESQEHTKKIWLQIAPQMRTEMANVREKIRAELTPKQRQQFEELMKHPRRVNNSSSNNGPPHNSTNGVGLPRNAGN